MGIGALGRPAIVDEIAFVDISRLFGCRCAAEHRIPMRVPAEPGNNVPMAASLAQSKFPDRTEMRRTFRKPLLGQRDTPIGPR